MYWSVLQSIFAASTLVEIYLLKVALLLLLLFDQFFLNFRIAEYHLNQYKSAHAAFTQGHQLDGECGLFWFPEPSFLHHTPLKLEGQDSIATLNFSHYSFLHNCYTRAQIWDQMTNMMIKEFEGGGDGGSGSSNSGGGWRGKRSVFASIPDCNQKLEGVPVPGHLQSAWAMYHTSKCSDRMCVCVRVCTCIHTVYVCVCRGKWFFLSWSLQFLTHLLKSGLNGVRKWWEVSDWSFYCVVGWHWDQDWRWFLFWFCC